MISAMLVLPFPDSPCRNIDWAELIAGPTLSSVLLIEDQRAEGRFDVIPGDPHLLDRLPAYPVTVLRERNRRRTDVHARRRHRLAGAGASLRGQVEDVAARLVSLGALDLHEPALLHGEQLLVHEGERAA